jgi:membrane protease subunit HflK
VAGEEVERKAGRTVRRIGLALLLLAGLVTWQVLTGVYQLNPGEAAVILRLGVHQRTETQEGLRLHLPWPIESRDVVNVSVSQRREFGSTEATEGDALAETAMQTGDNNIVLVEFVVQYRVGDPFRNRYRVTESQALLEEAAQAAMREVVGRNTIDGVLSERKGIVASEAAERLQQLLDSYEAGITITDIELQDAQAPDAVRQAFSDVIAANQDRNRAVNEAEAHANEVVPRARGEASELLASAQAYRDEKIAVATGEANRFVALLTEYEKAPAITRKRLYLETMEQVLPETEKLIVEPGTATVLPYLPLGPGVQRPRSAP